MPERVDHKAEALRLLSCLGGPDHENRVDRATTYALLAIAEGQERVAEELNGVKRHLVSVSSQLIEAMTEPDCEEESR